MTIHFFGKRKNERRPDMANELTNTNETTGLRRLAMPVNIAESEEAYELVAEIPGASRETVTIQLENDELTIEARADLPAGGKTVLSEFGPTLYARTFSVGRQIDRERIEARVENGILNLKLGKARDAKPRRIEIQSA